MMGSKGLKGGNEYDCLTRGGRRYVKLSPKEIRCAKRTYWKRMRRQARIEARRVAQEEAAN